MSVKLMYKYMFSLNEWKQSGLGTNTASSGRKMGTKYR